MALKDMKSDLGKIWKPAITQPKPSRHGDTGMHVDDHSELDNGIGKKGFPQTFQVGGVGGKVITGKHSGFHTEDIIAGRFNKAETEPYSIGKATLTNQLGNPDGSSIKFGNTGWHSKNKYGDTISKLKQGKGSLIKSVFKGNGVDVQRWGGKAGVAEGKVELMRGGIITSAHRALEDTKRVGKFLTSGKGLLWIAKNVGMQIMNARPETRVFPLGLKTLAQTPVTPFGIHLTRHGVLFPKGYEDIKDYNIKDDGGPKKSNIFDILTDSGKPSRYENLVKETVESGDSGIGQKLKTLKPLAKAHSVYGIGGGDIRRQFNTQDKALLFPETSVGNNPGYEIQGGSTKTNYVKLKQYSDITKVASGKSKNYEGVIRGAAIPKGTSKNKSIEYTYWMGSQGKTGRDRSDEYKDYSIDTGDKIGLTGVIDEEKKNFPGGISKVEDFDQHDFIPLRFRFTTRNDEMQEVSKCLVFRATLSGLSENISPSWTPTQYVGRPDKVYVYGGADRVFNFGFQLYPMTRQELKPMYQKLNQLMGLAYPGFQNIVSSVSTSGQRMTPPFVKLTIGSLFKDAPGFLSSLGVSVDDKATWELDPGQQVPKSIKITCGFTWIGDEVPSINTKFYATDLLKEE